MCRLKFAYWLLKHISEDIRCFCHSVWEVYVLQLFTHTQIYPHFSLTPLIKLQQRITHVLLFVFKWKTCKTFHSICSHVEDYLDRRFLGFVMAVNQNLLKSSGNAQFNQKEGKEEFVVKKIWIFQSSSVAPFSLPISPVIQTLAFRCLIWHPCSSENRDLAGRWHLHNFNQPLHLRKGGVGERKRVREGKMASVVEKLLEEKLLM